MLPNPWVIIGALVAFIGVAVGGFFYGEHIEALSWKASIAHQEAEASALLTQLTETAAKKDSAAAEFARNLDERQAHENEAIAAAADTAERTYAERLRVIASSRPRCPGSGATEAIDLGKPQGTDPGGKDQLLAESGRILRELGEGAEQLKNTLATCRAWVLENGR